MHTNSLSISSQEQEEEGVTGDNGNSIHTLVYNSNINNNVIGDDATTQMTEINISPSHNDNNSTTNSPYINDQLWTDEECEDYQEGRRESLGQELNRAQRMNSIHFSILRLILIALIAVALMNSYQNDA